MTECNIKRTGRTAIGETTRVPEQNINVHGDVIEKTMLMIHAAIAQNNSAQTQEFAADL
jgi:hypothetical protein